MAKRTAAKKSAGKTKSTSKRFAGPKLIGVTHLSPLGGAPKCNVDPREALEIAGARAIAEAKAFEKAGFDGIILENFGDVPFYKDSVPPETIASISVLAAALKEVSSLKLGINVLRNDAHSALAIAAVTGCDFIRVNVWSGVTATDQGWVESNAAFLARERTRLGASVAIFADAWVKHGVSYSSLDLVSCIEDLVGRSLADAVIISGAKTGSPPGEDLNEAFEATRGLGIPCYVGSGISSSNVASIKRRCDGMIVSSDLRKNGKAGADLDPKRLKRWVDAYRSVSRRAKGKSTRKKMR